MIYALVLWFPSSGLGTQLAKLQLRESGSWSFQDCIPKPELGNERIAELFPLMVENAVEPRMNTDLYR